MVSVPVRCVGSVLASKWTTTSPLPVPLAPLVMIIHDGWSLDAVHPQLELDAVT